MLKLKISKKNLLMYLLQIYIFAVIAWDYEIFYQIPLLVMFLFSLLRYNRVADAIKTSSFFHGYFVMMMYFILQYVLGFTVSSTDSKAYLVTGMINLATILCVASIVDQAWKIEKVLSTIIAAAFSVSLYNLIRNLPILLSGGLASHCYKLFYSMPTYSHSTIPMFCAFSVMALAYFSLKDRWKLKNILLIIYFVISFFIFLLF